jgi:hypothetical protein
MLADDQTVQITLPATQTRLKTELPPYKDLAVRALALAIPCT